MSQRLQRWSEAAQRKSDELGARSAAYSKASTRKDNVKFALGLVVFACGVFGLWTLIHG